MSKKKPFNSPPPIVEDSYSESEEEAPMKVSARDRSNESARTAALVKCHECGNRLYPCERTLEAVQQDLRDFVRAVVKEKLEQLYNKIDESIRIEEVLSVNSPQVLEARYKHVKNDQQRKWNQALRKYHDF